MAILTHGSDLSLAPTLTPMVPLAGGSVRAALEHIARLGFESVQLDATLRGLRPRELDRGGRRELMGTVRRRGLRIAGLDLLIPRRHYLEPDHVDRAMAATLATIELAADLDRVPVSLSLPVGAMSSELAEAITEAADGRSIRVAVHGEDEPDALAAWLDAVDLATLGAALDPAVVLGRGDDPATAAQRWGPRLSVARLSDVERAAGGARCVPGRGELDMLAYRVSLDLATQRAGPVVLDLRALTDPARAAVEAKRAWENAAATL